MAKETNEHDIARIYDKIDEVKKEANALAAKSYDKIDETNKNVNQLALQMARVEEAIKNQKPLPRPCPDHITLANAHNRLQEDFNHHISEHDTMDKEVKQDKKETIKMWRNSGINLFFELLKLAIVALVGGAIGFFIGK